MSYLVYVVITIINQMYKYVLYYDLKELNMMQVKN